MSEIVINTEEESLMEEATAEAVADVMEAQADESQALDLGLMLGRVEATLAALGGRIAELEASQAGTEALAQIAAADAADALDAVEESAAMVEETIADAEEELAGTEEALAVEELLEEAEEEAEEDSKPQSRKTHPFFRASHEWKGSEE